MISSTNQQKKQATGFVVTFTAQPSLTILWKRVFDNKQKPQTLYVCVMRDMTKSYPKWQSCAVHAVKTQRD
jgi:hypothetical protein